MVVEKNLMYKTLLCKRIRILLYVIMSINILSKQRKHKQTVRAAQVISLRWSGLIILSGISLPRHPTPTLYWDDSINSLCCNITQLSLSRSSLKSRDTWWQNSPNIWEIQVFTDRSLKYYSLRSGIKVSHTRIYWRKLAINVAKWWL